MAANPMLSSYRSDPTVAGQYKKTGDRQGGVAAIMRDRADQYGPSQELYDHWKRSGIPTAEVRQPTTFGMATQKGDSAGDCFTFGKPAPPPAPAHHGRAPVPVHQQPRANPITWDGGMEEPAPRRTYDRLGRSTMEPEAAAVPPPMPPPPQPPQPPQQFEQGETWAMAMRAGKVRQSSALCMIEMPPQYSLEAPPPVPPVASFAVNTIGLHPQNQGRPVRRSNAFTSDFRDPFL